MLAGLLQGGRCAAAVAVVTMVSVFSPGVKAQSIDFGFACWFDLAPGGGKGAGPIFCGGWGVADAVAIVSGSSVTLQPNFNTYADNPGDAFWRDNGGAGPGGNKWGDMNVYGEETLPASGSESTETFTGCAVNTLASPYTSQAFIKVFSTSFDLRAEVFAPASGTFNLSVPIAGDEDVVVQKGFLTAGPNANPDNAEALGSVGITIGAPCAASGPSGGVATNIPVLPVWALALLAGVLGLFGARVAGKRSR